MDRYTDSYLNEMRTFVDSIRHGKAVPAGARDGLMAVRIGLAAKKSAAENRVVPLGEIE
jgi:myo-inositol 2-dehydrogenase/D-chiro-inositol 1-dehydrogenase